MGMLPHRGYLCELIAGEHRLDPRDEAPCFRVPHVEVFHTWPRQLFLNHVLHSPLTYPLLIEEDASLTVALQDQGDGAQLLREAELVILPAGFPMDEHRTGCG